MLPSLRLILAAVIAACAAVLTLSAGFLGARDPARNVSGVPDLSRTLVRQAIVDEPEWRQSQVLAYSSRRADELLRLRELPVTPVRAVVEYAEQAQARAAETASAPAAPAASEPAPTIVATAPAATPPADAPPAATADSAAAIAAPPADTPTTEPGPTIATAPVANPPADTTTATAATAVAAAPVATPPAETPSVAASVSDTAAAAAANVVPSASPPASGDTQVAAVQPGGSETAEMYGPVQPAAAAKPHRGGKTVHARPAKPKKKPQVARPPRNIAPATTTTASTGFTIDQPSDRPNNGFGNWRRSSNESTTR